MKVLLLAGLGPYFKQGSDLIKTLFDPKTTEQYRHDAARYWPDQFQLDDLVFRAPNGNLHKLLRRERSGSLALNIDQRLMVERTSIPSLSASTLTSVLIRAAIDHEYLPLDRVWEDGTLANAGTFDCVLLSTTFICDRRSLARAVSWIVKRMPGVPIIVGGQFSNLKYREILRTHPEVIAVVRGDGEVALPALLQKLAEGGKALTGVSNLALRGPHNHDVILTGFEYIDIEAYPEPFFTGPTPIVPYESMRGCPYACRFCSFPSASPKWRYKSAARIVADWTHYRDVNGALHIRALDSTFTVPRTRFGELLDLLPEVGVGWEAFTRADILSSRNVVDSLVRSHCRTLSIGFESMSDNTLKYMDKRVSSASNRRAFHLLRGSQVGYRASFITGYPGETPEDYEKTHDFLVGEYAGHFQLSVFSLQDQTMPVWQDAERFKLRIADPDDPDDWWAHSGMDQSTAVALRKLTLRDVRWKNEDAVPFLWQTDYQTPLMPHRSAAENYRVEKLVERIGCLPIDFPDPKESGARLRRLLDNLDELGVSVLPRAADAPRESFPDSDLALDEQLA
jgi:anaerobic magnesium-protoporphyrin IX monomethyl ester cyclase